MATPIPTNQAALGLDAIRAATRGSITRRGAADQAIGVTADSRAITKGGLFIALKGESHDGHRFVGTAADAGAAIAIVERARTTTLGGSLADLTVVEVDDTLVALGDLARVHLAAWRDGNDARRVVAITGSAGKTTTKELTAALLAAVGPTHRSAGNLNNRVGVPFVVLGIVAAHRFAVLEMGMSLPGELDAITSFAPPDVAIVTNVGLAHAEGVGGPEGVMREKAAVYRALDERGVAIVNVDDVLATKAAEGTAAGRVVTFGMSAAADYRLLGREPDLSVGGARVLIACSGQNVGPSPRILELRFPLAGEAAALDLAAAIAVQEAATGAELSAFEIEAALAHVALEGRAAVRRLGGDILVVDDTYNANPASMRAALATLSELGKDRRTVVVLGEMMELGAHAEREHDALGDILGVTSVAVAIGCGGLINRTLSRAEHAGASISVVRGASTDDAVASALALVRPGDAVLVKGSRSVGAERVVAALTEAWPVAGKSGYVAGSG